jgi:hypothetical protein
VLTVARWVLFAISIAALGSVGERLGRRATVAGDLRLAAAGALTAAIAVAETLLLGLVGLGGNAVVIAAAAAITGVGVRFTVPARGPSSTDLARDAWRRLSAPARGLLGAWVAIVVTETAYLVWRPAIGTDGLIYHLADPAIWVTDGRPGSMHPTVSGLPIQAYPKTGEVLFSWAIGTARTPVVTTLVMVAAAVLAAACTWSVLRRIGVDQWIAVMLSASLIGCPVMITQLSGPNTDLLTLTWVLCTAALCRGAISESSLLPVALVAGGVAVGTKTTAIPIVVVLLAVTGWLSRREVARHRLTLALAGATALGIGAVWYIQDLVVYHAPLYPFSRFPAGPKLPPVITVLGARFLRDPAAAVRVATATGYARGLGAGLVLAVGVVLTAVLLPTVRERRLRGLIAIAVAAAAAEALLWSAAPFTGWSGQPGSRTLVLAGIRYLLPGLALFAVAVGLASRVGGVLGLSARGFTAAALAADLWADTSFQVGVRPHLPTILAAALVGALAATAIGLRDRWPAGFWRAVAAAVALVAIGAMSVATHGYLGRHLTVARAVHVDEPAILTYLAQQPAWSHGHLPIASGPVADALFAGPTFDHPLSVITEQTSCRVVRADARQGWVVLPSRAAAPEVPGAASYDRSRCLAGTPPTFSSGGVSVFRPNS